MISLGKRDNAKSRGKKSIRKARSKVRSAINGQRTQKMCGGDFGVPVKGQSRKKSTARSLQVRICTTLPRVNGNRATPLRSTRQQKQINRKSDFSSRSLYHPLQRRAAQKIGPLACFALQNLYCGAKSCRVLKLDLPTVYSLSRLVNVEVSRKAI